MAKISIIPDRLAHYRVPVFNQIAAGMSRSEIRVYADLRTDKSRIKKPNECSVLNAYFRYKKSIDIRFIGRLILSTGSFKSVFDDSDVVIIWGDASCIGNWLSSFAIKTLTNKKLVYWTHGLYGKESYFVKKIRLMFYSLADSLLLYGRNAKEILVNEGFSEEKMFVINNSLDFHVQENLYEKWNSSLKNLNNDLIRLLFVGRLTKNKNIDLLIYTLSELNENYAVELTIIGDGEVRSSLENLCCKLEIQKRVIFYGETHEEDTICKAILAADMVVSPGNVGLTAMHSLVYGTPVISHSNPSHQMPEFEAIRPAFSGELFDEGNQDSLAESIIRCKKNLQKGVITRETCRNVLKQYYSPNYQLRIFKEFLTKGLGIK